MGVRASLLLVTVLPLRMVMCGCVTETTDGPISPAASNSGAVRSTQTYTVHVYRL